MGKYKNQKGYVPRRVKRIRNGKTETTTAWVRATPRQQSSEASINSPQKVKTRSVSGNQTADEQLAAMQKQTEQAYQKYRKTVAKPTVPQDISSALLRLKAEEEITDDGVIYHMPRLLEEKRINGGPVYSELDMTVTKDGEYQFYEMRYNEVPDPQWEWDEDDLPLTTRDPVEAERFLLDRLDEVQSSYHTPQYVADTYSPWSAPVSADMGVPGSADSGEGFCKRCGANIRGLMHPHNCPGAGGDYPPPF